MSRSNMGLLPIIFILHLFFLVSIFDIYFRSPIIEEPIKAVNNNLITNTKRLVLFVGDGLPAEHLFDFSSGYSKAPFLRSVIENKGSWGVSHTRVPTESRPGHVAMIAGFYEDPSAVFRGWKENPVLFDSVFNQSAITFSWGSPDIVPMFSKGPKTDHIHYFTYSSEMEDMSGKNHSAAQLDSWVLNNFKQFIQYNFSSYNIYEKSQLIFFFHLLGTDVAGHANKPYTLQYESTIKNMDRVVKELHSIIEKLFDDDKTTYLFTSDHGMTVWGSHGAGSMIETETPIIVWGAGIKKPLMSNNSVGLTPDNWKLSHLYRHDINQADIAVLMSVLLGVSIPVHSVGTLPLDFLDFSEQDRAKAYILNAMQLVTQLKAKEYQVRSQLANCFFYPFPNTIISNYEEVIYNIGKAIASLDFLAAEDLTHHLIVSSLAGLDYYNTYFQNFLLTCTVLSFLGLGAIVIAEIMYSYSSDEVIESEPQVSRIKIFILKMAFSFIFLFSIILTLVNALPRRFIIYLVLPLSLWYWTFLKYSWILSHIDVFKRSVITKIILYGLGLKLIVLSFTSRWLLSLILFGLCVWPMVNHKLVDAPKEYKLVWYLSCIGLSVFPFLPIVGGEEQLFFKIFTGCAWIIVEFTLHKSSTLKYLGLKFNFVSLTQLFFTPLLLWNIYTITNSFKRGEGLPLVNQCISYFLLVLFLGLMFGGPNTLISRFNTVSCSVGLIFLMFSSSYEAIFPLFLAPNLLCWILFERIIKANSTALFMIVLLLCNSMAIQFLFNVNNKGSWLEIGTSISHFVIMKSIVLFLFILFHCTKYITTLKISSSLDCDDVLRKWHES
ncbi:unnamed protein product [Nezara viridula]|uniref:GPI ethanolamine phosphate transferase 1 n=1 Tax=Nezara viridula TaxID=85310 RepID=A0A9P0EBF9_NEZVI|nr:unnamed protein product [Nezara viridula]